jgi:hypothetical protein
MKIRIVRLVGIVLFVAAFFLPSARDAGTGPGSGPMIGWMCAIVAGSAIAGIFHLSSSALQGKDVLGVICLILSGLVNPLVLLYLLFSIWAKFVRIRRVLTVAILVCFAATWAFFFKSAMSPLAGHFVWVTGALMILAGEALGQAPSKGNKDL